MQHKKLRGFVAKDFAGEVFNPHYFTREGGVRPVSHKESRNGLEDAEDCRSAGWDGNQHVCVRRPQVSGSDLHYL